MTIVLAVIAAQQAFNVFNNDMVQRLTRLEERMSALTSSIAEARTRRDAQIEGIGTRLLAVEQRR